VQARLQAEHGRHEHLGEVYLTPTVLRGGDADQLNVIPSVARVGFDVRTLPGVDHATLVDDVTRAAHAAVDGTGVAVDVTVVDDRPAVDSPIEHPVVAALAAAHEAVTGRSPVYGGVPGATDGTILTRDAGLTTVVYGPGGKWIAHQADEYVEVADVIRCARVYAETARRFLTRADAGQPGQPSRIQGV
jgi:succinyl-diaminopimelate desuccinylase